MKYLLSICLSLFITSYSFPQLQIMSVSPKQNSINVSDSTKISVTFSEDINPETLVWYTFFVHGSQTGRRNGIIEYNTSTRTAVLKPLGKFRAGEQIMVTLTKFVTSTTGDSLKNGFHWNFFIQAVKQQTQTNIQTINFNLPPYDIKGFDFKNNGNLDLVSTVSAGRYSAGVTYIENNNGVFNVGDTYSISDGSNEIIAGDFNLDGVGDFIVSNGANPDYIRVFMNYGNSKFQFFKQYSIGDAAAGFKFCDIDGDGDLDIIIGTDNGSGAKVFRNDGNANLSLPVVYGSGDVYNLALADIDNDGDYDMIIKAGSQNSKISIYKNNGDGNFVLYTDTLSISSPNNLELLDIDADNYVDLIATSLINNVLSVWKNDHLGNFSQKQDYAINSAPKAISLFDYDGDGDFDIIIGSNNNNIYLYKNDGSGKFTMTNTIKDSGSGINSLYAGDFDNDKAIDLAVANSLSKNISIIPNYVLENSQVNVNDTLRFTVYPSQNTLLIPSMFSTALPVKLPPGTYDVTAAFNDAHAGGDLDGVFFAAQTGETSTQWPNGHAILESFHTTKTTISFPNAPDTVKGYLFFEDTSDLSDNPGSVTVTFKSTTSNDTINFKVYPNQNTFLIPSNFSTALQVKLAPGTYDVVAFFNGAHAGGDLDGVFFAAQTGETSGQWPKGHSILESFHTTKTTISFSNAQDSVTGYLFFEDTSDLSDNPGSVTVTFIKTKLTNVPGYESKIPSSFVLNQNYPNPFNPTTTIKYSVPRTSFVSLKVYDALGREIKTLVNEEKSLGNYQVEFNASKLSSGVYFYRMQAGNFVETKKLVLLK